MYFIMVRSKRDWPSMNSFKSNRIPKWLWFFLLIIGFSFLTPLIEPLKSAPSAIVCVIFGLLIVFPGKDPVQPRLIRLLPLFWSLEFLSAALLLLLQSKPELLPEELRDQSVFLVASTLIWTPILAWHYFRKTRFFVTLFIVVSVASLGHFIWQNVGGNAKTDDFFQLLATLILTVYVWNKFPAYAEIKT